METSFQESGASCSSNGTNDSGDFECNICFELAQDPIITLCGHLFCWPCLYKWLHHHSKSQECPVCKAVIQKEKLVPLYGRGKTASDPRSRPVPGVDIPNRPAGQRPPTARPPRAPHYFSNLGFGLLSGVIPLATARFGTMTMSTGFGGLFPPTLNFQLNGFPDGAMYGASHGYPYGYEQVFRGGHAQGANFHGYQRTTSQGQDSLLKSILLVIAVLVLLALVWS